MSTALGSGGVGIPAPDRRSQLAATAYAVVADSGLDGLSLRTVARRVGATTGLVSHHFADRRDLLAAALEHAAATMFERVRVLPADADPLAVLAAVLPTDEPSRQVWRFSLSVRVSGLFDPEVRRFDETIRAHWDDHLPGRLTGLPARARRDAAR